MPHSTVEIAPTEWTSFGSAEHQGIRTYAYPVVDVRLDLRYDVRRQGDGSVAGIGLWRADHEYAPSQLLKLL
jgi:hypothetical protein